MPSSRRPELLRDPPARRVAGHDRRLEAVQAQVVEAVADDQRDALGDVAVPGVALVDPVADRRRLERSAVHGAEAHLADEPVVVAEEQAEAVRRVELALAVPRRAPGAERVGVGHGIGRLPGSGRGSHGSSQSRLAGRTSRHAAKSVPRSGRSSTRGPTSLGTSWRFTSPPRPAIASSAAGSSSPERSPGGSPSATARIVRRMILLLRVFGSAVVNVDRRRRERLPERVADPAAQIGAQRVVDDGARRDHHVADERLALELVGQPDRRGLDHRGMLHERGLHLGRARAACPRA